MINSLGFLLQPLGDDSSGALQSDMFMCDIFGNVHHRVSKGLLDKRAVYRNASALYLAKALYLGVLHAGWLSASAYIDRNPSIHLQ